jgi:hypothetical protein
MPMVFFFFSLNVGTGISPPKAHYQTANLLSRSHTRPLFIQNKAYPKPMSACLQPIRKLLANGLQSDRKRGFQVASRVSTVRRSPRAHFAISLWKKKIKKTKFLKFFFLKKIVLFLLLLFY